MMRRVYRILEPYLYLLPTIVGLALFTAGAVAISFVMSFSQWDIVTPPRWIWLDNYVQLWKSNLFWQVFWNTLYFVVLSVPLSVVSSLALALLVNTRLRGI